MQPLVGAECARHTNSLINASSLARSVTNRGFNIPFSRRDCRRLTFTPLDPPLGASDEDPGADTLAAAAAAALLGVPAKSSVSSVKRSSQKRWECRWASCLSVSPCEQVL